MKAAFAEQLKAYKPPTPVVTEDDKDKKVKVDPALAALQAKVEELLGVNVKERAAREAAETKQREDRAYNDLKDFLKSKVRPDMVDIAADYLFHAKRRIEFEDGTPLMKVRRSPGPGMSEEDVLMPLTDGVASWLGSKEATVFLPAPQPGGNSNRGSKMPPSTNQLFGQNGVPKYDTPAKTDEEKIRRAMERAEFVKKQQR